MKTKKFTGFLLALAATCTLTSCSNDDDEKAASPDRQALLTSKTWSGSKIAVDNEDVTAVFVDYYNIETISQYTYKFENTGRFTNAIKDSTISGNWQLIQNNAQLVLHKDGSTPDTFEIATVTATDLTLRQTTMKNSTPSTSEYMFK